jgi:hypothetical protein
MRARALSGIGAALVAAAAVALVACFVSDPQPVSDAGAADGPVSDAGADGPSSSDAGPSCPLDLPTACPTPAPSFQTSVFPTIQARCWGCHGDGGIEVSTHPLETYDLVFAQRRSVLTQVYGCLMPPADASALTSEERAALLGWLVCGAPNN